MASAVLVNRKDADWPPKHKGGTARAGFMGKAPFANSNPNPNSTKNLKRSQFQFHGPSSGGDAGHYNSNGFQIDESPAVTQTASDDASSINHHRRSGEGGEVGLRNSQYVSFSVKTCSRKELGELKSRLVGELDRIRQLQRRIEAGELNSHDRPQQPPIKKSNPSKKFSGSKRPFPVSTNHQQKDPPPILKRPHYENPNLMKNCGQLMTKLMKHKHAWVFNKPVDVIGMGLHDYNDIIKRPMDLGTVKTNLSRNSYSSVSNFASDVRLTFQNAMAYNPKGHEVHTMAEQLLMRFEELFAPLGEKLAADRSYEVQASSWDHTETERPVKKREERKHEPAFRPAPVPIPTPALVPTPPPPPPQAPASSSNPVPNTPPVVQSPVRTPSPPMRSLPAVKPLKQPKPKAKDPNKREMSIEEKHKLGVGLQTLPQEKMEQVVQIISKRNGHLKQDGDEIELDIEAVDTETLWELDRLVTNYKKMVSKIKRQALMTNLIPNNNASGKSHMRESMPSERMDSMAEPKRPKKGEAGDEDDVDIGDDLPVSSFPPVEIEKDDKDLGVGVSGGGDGAGVGPGRGGHASSSSSSGSSSSSSDSSSSSGSDSGSSSGSDSDDDNAHS